MIISFEGPMGTGKTMSAVALIYTDMVQRHIKVIANIHLKFNHIYMDAEKLIEYLKETEDSEAEDCDILFDEAYQIMDARASASKLNQLFTDFTMQTRKRNADLYVCFHHIDTVDKRLRRNIDYRGTCNMRNETPCTECNGDGYVYSGARKLKERKLAVYRSNGLVVPVLVGSKSTYHGIITYNVKNLLPSTDILRKQFPEKMTVSEADLFFKELVSENEWHHLFDGILKQGEGEKVECQRCLGFGETGWATVRFRDMQRGQSPKTLRIFGPAAWPLYNTKERIPLTQRQLRVKEEDL